MTQEGARCPTQSDVRVVPRRRYGASYALTQKGHLMNAKPILSIVVSSAVVAGYISIAGCGGGGGEAHAQMPVFTVTSPDLASGTFASQYFLNGFGCTGSNISPAVTWTNPPAGTKSFVLNVFDPDAPTGSGFWH